MFQALSGKVITGIVTLSMLLLSSYEGNNAKFGNMTAIYLGSRIHVSAALVNAFENDFEEYFRSGQRIEIFFNIEIFKRKELIHENEFRHAVIFDPIGKIFHVFLEEQNIQTTTTSYAELLELISLIEYDYNEDDYESGQVVLSAHMKKIRLQSLNKEYDLMMLWKFKKPRLSRNCEPAKIEI